VFGLNARQVIGMTHAHVVGRHAVELVERNIEAALAGEGTMTDRVLLDGDGGLQHFQVTYSPNRVAGQTVGYSTLWVDVTSQLHILAEVSRDSAHVARLLQRQRLMALAGTEVLEQLGAMTRALDGVGPLPDPDALVDVLASAIAQLREAAEVGVGPRSGDTRLVVVGLDHERELEEPPAREAWFAPVAAGRLDNGVAAVGALLDELPVAITEWDPDRRLRYVNRAAAEFLGQWGEGSFVGRRLEEIGEPGFVEAIEPYAEAALAGEAQSYYRREQGPDGDWKHFHVRYVPRLAGGEVVGVYAYATDVSLRMEAARALASARAEQAALQERQAMHDQLHAAVLQHLFGAKLAVEMAGRSAEPSGDDLRGARESVAAAADSLREIFETS